jgi:hypothetical protein
VSSDVDDVGDDVVDGGGGVMTMGDEMVGGGERLGI